MNKAETDFVSKAVNFATMKHLGQKDDDGEDYYMAHLHPVLLHIHMFTQDCEVVAASVLHDTLEDTETTYDELVEHFGKRVADLVNEVTHEGKPDNYGYYFPRLHSKEAILIKLIDRASNISRMNNWPKQRQASYLKKTKFWKSETPILAKVEMPPGQRCTMDKNGIRTHKNHNGYPDEFYEETK